VLALALGTTLVPAEGLGAGVASATLPGPGGGTSAASEVRTPSQTTVAPLASCQ
jgi:hypothetical protein